MRLPLAVLLGLLAMSGCKSAQVHSMARTVRIADMRFADEYAEAASKCLAESDDWGEYDGCMGDWYVAYAAMRNLISTTLSLDVSKRRGEFREAGCRWYRSLEAVDATSPVELPAIQAGLSSRWRRRCTSGKR